MLVLDTNIVSYLIRNHWPIDLYLPHLQGKVLTISFMTFAEILEGAYRLKQNPKKAQEILRILSKYKVLPCNDRICDLWARIRAERFRQPIAVDDAWIAATAIAYDIPLVTHNARDFEGITDLQMITEHQ